MKKSILLLLVTLFAGIAAFGQEEDQIKLTFNVDDPARVQISIFSEVQEGLQAGDNVFYVDPWTNVEIAAVEGSVLTSVVNSSGESLSVSDSNTVGIFVSDGITEETYTVTSALEGMVSFSIEVDEPSKVSVTDKNFTAVPLEAGINEMTVSENNMPLYVGAAEYGESIYSVTLDGEEVPYNYGYSIMPTQGSVVVITVEFPDKDCTVTFESADGIEDFFTAVLVNDTGADSFLDGMTVRCGDNVALYYNPSFWLTEDEGDPVVVKINGETPGWFGPGYSFTVRDNTTVTVEQAVRAPEISVTVDIDNPANIILYRVSDMYKDVVNLSTGVNTVSLPRDNASLVIAIAKDEYRIDGVTVNDRPRSVDYYNYVEVSDLEDGDVVKIFTFGDSAVDGTTAVSELSGDVYSIDGIKVLTGATSEEISALPRGLYICNGHKFVVR